MKKLLLIGILVLGLVFSWGSVVLAKKGEDNSKAGGDQMQSNSVENFIEDMEAIPEEEQEEVYNQKLEQMYKLEANTLKSNGNENVKARKLEVIREKIEILKVLLGCDDVTHAEGRMCVSNFRDCEVENGIGQETWDEGWGVCTVVSCDADYHTEDDLTCIEDTREADCGGTIPSSASASSSASYTQLWNGSAWEPELDWEFGADPCGFECDVNYTWDGTACISDTRLMDCSGIVPANAVETTPIEYEQLWNGSMWEPDGLVWEFEADTCGFVCAVNYIWDGTSCVANTQEAPCEGPIPPNMVPVTPPVFNQTWNGMEWIPPQMSWEYGAPECGLDCDLNYTWDGTACISDTRLMDCSGIVPDNAVETTPIEYEQLWNGSIWEPDGLVWEFEADTCGFLCMVNYTWDGTSCVADTREVECGGDLPANSVMLTSPTYTQYWDGNVWIPDLQWEYLIYRMCGFECATNYIWDGSACVVDESNIVGDDTVGRNWSDGTFAVNCLSYLNGAPGYIYEGATGDGIYWIDPDGPGGNGQIKAYCDMTTDGGGWTMVRSGLRDKPNSPAIGLSWLDATGVNAYFSTIPTGNKEEFEVYYGLELWNQLLGMAPGELRYEWSTGYGLPKAQEFIANILPFNPGDNYAIHMTNYNQTVGSTTAGLYAYHNNKPFSSFDMDNDEYSESCSAYFGNYPWWFGYCWSGTIYGGGENFPPYLDGAYWLNSAPFPGTPEGQGAGNGWIWIR